jgi:hypothetical protein
MLYDMKARRRRERRVGPRKPAEERKDHLIQARVPRELDDVLKREAKKRRLSVSHLIRNVLEDTYRLVDGVISEVDNIVQDSVELGGIVRREAKNIARSANDLRSTTQRAAGSERRPASTRADDDDLEDLDDDEPEADSDPRPTAAGESEPELAASPRQPREPEANFERRTRDIYAWNPVRLHRAAKCTRCDRDLTRGSTAHLGLSQDPTAAPRWLCPSCLQELEPDP